MSSEDIALYGDLWDYCCFSEKMPEEDAEKLLPYGWISSKTTQYCISKARTRTYDHLVCFEPDFSIYKISANLLLERTFRLENYKILCFPESIEEVFLLGESMGKKPAVVEGLIFYS